MKTFNSVAIVGIGLIGGSLALAIKEKKLASEVIGVSRHKKNLSLAKKIGAIDIGSQHISAVRHADLVIVSAPVGAILELAPAIAKVIKPDCIVFDVGSTKQEIVSAFDKLCNNFVGVHPLAGSEKRGVANSDAALFEGSLCIVTPTKHTNRDALTKIRQLWSAIGAKVAILPPDTHDTILSFVSHLPHIAAFSLVNAVPREYLRFASTGFKDTTRIAASDSEIWFDIFLSNRKELLKAIGAFEHNLSRIKSAIVNNDKESLRGIIEQANNKRIKLSSLKFNV
jgi:prephenate dehydrogenase